MKSPFCTSAGVRTLDPMIKSQMLYQLSYRRNIYLLVSIVFLICGCKGSGFYFNYQIKSQFFIRKLLN